VYLKRLSSEVTEVAVVVMEVVTEEAMVARVARTVDQAGAEEKLVPVVVAAETQETIGHPEAAPLPSLEWLVPLRRPHVLW
jgi:hypothetical protein